MSDTHNRTQNQPSSLPSGWGGGHTPPLPPAWCRASRRPAQRGALPPWRPSHAAIHGGGCAVRRGRAVAGRRGRGGGVWCPAAGGPGGFLWFSALGVSRGFALAGGFAVSRGVSWCAGGSAVGAVVASAGRFGAGRWGVSLARAGLGAVVLGGGGRRGLRVCCGCGWLRGGLVGLGRFPAGGAAVRRRGGSGVRRLRAGGRPAVAAVGRSRFASGSRLGAGRLAVAIPPLPLLVARVGGCRWRWLARAGARCLAVRCSSLALAALVCRRARAFGLPPVRAGRSGRLVLLPAARPRGPSALSLRFAGPPALAPSPALPGVPLPVPSRGGRSRAPTPACPGRAVSFAQGRLF